MLTIKFCQGAKLGDPLGHENVAGIETPPSEQQGMPGDEVDLDGLLYKGLARPPGDDGRNGGVGQHVQG